MVIWLAVLIAESVGSTEPLHTIVMVIFGTLIEI